MHAVRIAQPRARPHGRNRPRGCGWGQKWPFRGESFL